MTHENDPGEQHGRSKNTPIKTLRTASFRTFDFRRVVDMTPDGPTALLVERARRHLFHLITKERGIGLTRVRGDDLHIKMLPREVLRHARRTSERQDVSADELRRSVADAFPGTIADAVWATAERAFVATKNARYTQYGFFVTNSVLTTEVRAAYEQLAEKTETEPSPVPNRFPVIMAASRYLPDVPPDTEMESDAAAQHPWAIEIARFVLGRRIRLLPVSRP